MDENETFWLGQIIIYPTIIASVFLILPPIAGIILGSGAMASTYWIIWTLFWTVIVGRAVSSALKPIFHHSLGRIGDWLLLHLIAAMTSLSAIIVVLATGAADLKTFAGLVFCFGISMTAFVIIETIPWLNKVIARHMA